MTLGWSKASLRWWRSASWSGRACSLAVLLLGLLASRRVSAQGEPGSELTVHVVTMGQGDLVYERFGHNGIWIRNATLGTDVLYNWGVFDDDEPGFIGRFLKGRMMYWTQPQDMARTVALYAQYNRSVYAQELNLTNAQKFALQEFVTWNAREENKYYRYDYYRDNCSTRVRDALDRVLGGLIRSTLDPSPAGTTYRSHTRLLTYADIPIYTGLMLAMGPFIDQRLSFWDEAFLPLELRENLGKVNITSADGSKAPLVVSERALFEASRAAPPDVLPSRLPYNLIAGIAIAGVLLLLAAWGLRSRAGRIAFIVVAGLVSFVIGLVGTVLALLWAFTDHVVTYRNENVLQLNSLSLVVFVALIGIALGKAWGFKFAQRFGLVVAGLAVLGFAIQVLPGVDQANGETIALFLPIHIALAWILSRQMIGPLRHSREAAASLGIRKAA